MLKGQQIFIPVHLDMCNKILFLKCCGHRVQKGATKFDLASRFTLLCDVGHQK